MRTWAAKPRLSIFEELGTDVPAVLGVAGGAAVLVVAGVVALSTSATRAVGSRVIGGPGRSSGSSGLPTCNAASLRP